MKLLILALLSLIMAASAFSRAKPDHDRQLLSHGGMSDAAKADGIPRRLGESYSHKATYKPHTEAPVESSGKGYYYYHHSTKAPKGKGKGKGGSYKAPKGKGKGKGGSYKAPKGKGKGGSVPSGKGKGFGPAPSGKGAFDTGSGKGYVPTISHCKQIPIFFNFEDLEKGFKKTSVGGGFDNVPFYHTETGELLGYYSDEATNYKSDDCVGSGAFSFGFENPYPSQIAFQFTCFGVYNTITGGNGAYGCALGFEQFVFDDGVVIQSEINLCTPLCPYVPVQMGPSH